MDCMNNRTIEDAIEAEKHTMEELLTSSEWQYHMLAKNHQQNAEWLSDLKEIQDLIKKWEDGDLTMIETFNRIFKTVKRRNGI